MGNTEVDILVGDPTLAANTIGWNPKVKFNELVETMVSEELNGFEDDKF